MTDVLTAAISALIFAAVPYALYLFHVWVAEHVKSAAGLRWAAGAESFAGQAYVALVQARAANPTVPLGELIRPLVAQKTEDFLRKYEQTAAALGANAIDAQTRLTGALGPMLAADPTVSVAAIIPKGVAG
jgi:hypothetical protein